MVTKGKVLGNGIETATAQPVASKALEVASQGINSCRDIANFALGHSIDTLRGVMGARDCNASLSGVRAAIQSINTGQRIGHDKNVAGVSA